MASQDKDREKMLGALVPAELFWEFKKTAAGRGEGMREALMNAVHLYLAIEEEDKHE